jgi:hypothetical protein
MGRRRDLNCFSVVDVDAAGDLLVLVHEAHSLWAHSRCRMMLIGPDMVERKCLFEFPQGTHFVCLDRQRALLYAMENKALKVVALTHYYSEGI